MNKPDKPLPDYLCSEVTVGRLIRKLNDMCYTANSMVLQDSARKAASLAFAVREALIYSGIEEENAG